MTKAMCNSGPPRHMCTATHVVEGSSGVIVLTCDLLSPHNGLHHDPDIFWREDLTPTHTPHEWVDHRNETSHS